MTDQFCISVIVPFYNSELSIKRCINSILKQDFEKTFEIIMTKINILREKMNKRI